MKKIILNKIAFILLLAVASLLLTALSYLLLIRFGGGYNNLPDFISGFTVWSNTTKSADLSAPFIYAAIFFILYFRTRRYIQKLPFSPLSEGNFIERAATKFAGIILYKNDTLPLWKKAALLFAGAFIVYFCSSAGYNYLTIPDDSLHFGEKLLGWWLANDQSSRIYETFYPIHNYKDLIPGFIGGLLNDNYASGPIIGSLLFYNLCLVIVSSAVLAIFPFVMSLIMLLPLRFITALPFVAMIILFKDDSVFKNYSKWLSLYCIFSILLYCLEPTSGIPFVLSLFPLCVYGFYFYYKNTNSGKFYLAIGAIAAALAVFFIIFRDYFMYSFEFFFNFAKYNSAAVGLPGYRDFEPQFLFIFRLAYKTPVYFLFPAFILLFFKELKRKEMRAAFFLSAMTIYLIASVNYALVRFDFDDMLRAHKLAMCYVYLLFPAFLYFNRDRYKKFLNFYILFMVLLLAFQIGFKFRYSTTAYVTEPTFGLSAKTIKDKFSVQRHPLEQNDIFRQGYSRFTKSGLDELSSIRMFFEDNGLTDKTFFDFTNKTVFYYHFNKKPLFPLWTYNNIIDPETDFQYAKKLLADLPDCVLLYSKNAFIFDKIRAPVRANSIYRTILLSGKYKLAVSGGGDILLVKGGNTSFSKTDIAILDYALGTNSLRYMPDAWGTSLNKLGKRLNELSPSFQTVRGNNKLVITFDKPLSAKILDFIFISGKLETEYDVFVNNDFILRASRNKESSLVPLDIRPAYLLGEDVKEITVVFSNGDAESIKNLGIKFFQRNRNLELNDMLNTGRVKS